jgi:hypothetical protein
MRDRLPTTHEVKHTTDISPRVVGGRALIIVCDTGLAVPTAKWHQ